MTTLIDELREAVERTYGGTVTYVQSVPVREEFKGKIIWESAVAIFDLADHATATRAYAFTIENDAGKRIVTVLHQPPVDSPQDAVRAAIVADYRLQG
jgi:hypothetical protein